MMKKFVIIVICMLTMTSFTCIAQNTSINNDTLEKYKTFFNEDVPTWQVGDYWSYDINALNLQVAQSGINVNLDLTITSFKSEVSSVTSSEYSLDLSGVVKGSFSFDDGSGSPIVGSFLFTKMSGSMQVRKSNLAMVSGKMTIKSIALISLTNPFAITLPIPLTMTVTIDHSSPRPFIDFPLFDEKTGIISGATPNIEVKIESIVLKILNIFIPDIPSEIIMPIGMIIPFIPYVTNQETVSVPKGSFDAYKMKLTYIIVDIGNLYYAPDVGNIAKLDLDVDIPDQYSLQFSSELIDFNHQ